MRHRLCLPLLSAALFFGCPDTSDLIEETGPAFELSDADPTATFDVEITFEPEGARRGYVQDFSINSLLTRSRGDQPLGVDLFVTGVVAQSGDYASTKVGAEPRALELGSNLGLDLRVQFVKQGAGAITGEWSAILDPEIYDFPEDAKESTPHLKITVVD
jgi:hypothetical protein